MVKYKKTLATNVIKNYPDCVEGDILTDESGVMSYKKEENYESARGRAAHLSYPLYARHSGESRSDNLYGDGMDLSLEGERTITGSHQHLQTGAHIIQGPNFTLVDSQVYCAFARFCQAFERMWNLAQKEPLEADVGAIHETGNHSAREWIIIDNETGEMIEVEEASKQHSWEESALGVMGSVYTQERAVAKNRKKTSEAQTSRPMSYRWEDVENQSFDGKPQTSSALQSRKLKPRKVTS